MANATSKSPPPLLNFYVPNNEEHDVLVSTPSTSSSSDSEFDSTQSSESSAKNKKLPKVLKKNSGTSNTATHSANTEINHTIPTLRANDNKRKTPMVNRDVVHDQPKSNSSGSSVIKHASASAAYTPSIPFAVDDALKDALDKRKPLLIEIFGAKAVLCIQKLWAAFPHHIRVSDGEDSIKKALKQASKKLSQNTNLTLREAAERVRNRDDWDDIIRLAAMAKTPKPTEAANAAVPCKMVFRLLQML
jgi:hypothetical protein